MTSIRFRAAACASALLTLASAAMPAQAPVITPAGDPSVHADSIYRLAIDPSTAKDEAALLLLDDGVLRLEADGRGTRTYRQVIEVLKPGAADRLREQQFSYAPKHERMTINWIRVVKPDGTVISEKPLQMQESDVPAQLGDPTYSDRKVIRASLTGVDVGTIVDFSITTEELKPFLPGDFLESWSINSGETVKRSRYIVDVPADLAIHVRENNLNFQRTDVRAGGRRVLTWATHDLAKVEPEEFAADSNTVYMSVNVSSPMTWAGIGAWYAGNARSRYTLTPAVEQKLASVLSGARTFDDSLRAVHKWVAQDIRYVAIALGLGGYQPRSPDEVVRTGFGDCKDKATLFVTALNRMGITAFPVLLSSVGGVRRDLPSIDQFDHAIAAYKRPGSAHYDYADLTAEFTPLGELPYAEQGEFGLVVHPDGSTEQIAFPRSAETDNSLRTTIAGAMSNTGTFDGVFEQTATGDQQYDLRAALANPLDSAQRAQSATGIAEKWFPGAQGDGFEGFAGKDLTAPVRIKSLIHNAELGSPAGTTFVLKNPLGGMAAFGNGARELDAKGKRLFPIDAEKIFGYGDVSIDLRVTLPDGWRAELPAGVEAKSPFGTYWSSYSQTGRELRLQRRLSGTIGIQGPEQLAALTAWMRKIATDNASFIIVHTEGAGR